MTLYILGNGFDIAHGLKTSFSDFKNFIHHYKQNDRNDIYLVKELYKNLSRDEWNDFERNIVNVNSQTIVELSRAFGGLDFVSFTLPLTLQQVMHAFINDAMHKWEERRVFNLKDNSLVLSFNYTDMPLLVYNVDHFNYFAIHGSYANSFYSSEERFIMGHDYYDFKRNEELEKENKDYKKLVQRLEKPVDELIKQDKTGFFEILKSEGYKINEIVIFGYSYSDIDNRYLKEIFRYVNKKVTIKAFYYTDNDFKKLSNFFDILGGEFNIIKICSKYYNGDL